MALRSMPCCFISCCVFTSVKRWRCFLDCEWRRIVLAINERGLIAIGNCSGNNGKEIISTHSCLFINVETIIPWHLGFVINQWLFFACIHYSNSELLSHLIWECPYSILQVISTTKPTSVSPTPLSTCVGVEDMERVITKHGLRLPPKTRFP